MNLDDEKALEGVGGGSDNEWEGTFLFRCPKCGKERRLNFMSNTSLFCPNCSTLMKRIHEEE